MKKILFIMMFALQNISKKPPTHMFFSYKEAEITYIS